MGQTPGDEQNHQPSLDLPSLSLPGFGRRKKSKNKGEEPSRPAAPERRAPEAAEPSQNGDATQLIEREQPDPARRKAPSTPKAPAIPGRVAAAITGLAVAVAGGAATYAALQGCEAVRGVSTCGGAPGFFILVAILALMVLLGGAILKAFRVAAPGSTSFLAVGMVAVISMLVLLDVILSPLMFVVIPVLGALAFLSAHWVTTRFDEAPTDLRR
ncbi:MAG TPA: hypothetical protein VLB29_10645 [Nocardioidaceae bacterium]|nr:hypothetical protein [Nocardioidaceae bacterium]